MQCYHRMICTINTEIENIPTNKTMIYFLQQYQQKPRPFSRDLLNKQIMQRLHFEQQHIHITARRYHHQSQHIITILTIHSSKPSSSSTYLSTHTNHIHPHGTHPASSYTVHTTYTRGGTYTGSLAHSSSCCFELSPLLLLLLSLLVLL